MQITADLLTVFLLLVRDPVPSPLLSVSYGEIPKSVRVLLRFCLRGYDHRVKFEQFRPVRRSSHTGRTYHFRRRPNQSSPDVKSLKPYPPPGAAGSSHLGISQGTRRSTCEPQRYATLLYQEMNRSRTPHKKPLSASGPADETDFLKFPGHLDGRWLPTGPKYCLLELEHMGAQRLFLLAVQHCTQEVLARLYTDLLPIRRLRPSAEMGDKWLRVVDAWAKAYNLLDKAGRVPDWIYTAVMWAGATWTALDTFAPPDWQQKGLCWTFDNHLCPIAFRILDESSMRTITSSGQTVREIADSVGATYALLDPFGRSVTLLGPAYYGTRNLDPPNNAIDLVVPVEPFHYDKSRSVDAQLNSYLTQTRDYLATQLGRNDPAAADANLRRSLTSHSWDHYVALVQIGRASCRERV